MVFGLLDRMVVVGRMYSYGCIDMSVCERYED